MRGGREGGRESEGEGRERERERLENLKGRSFNNL